MSDILSKSEDAAGVSGELVNLLKRDDLDAAQLMGLVRFVSLAEGLSEVKRTGYLLYLAGRLESYAKKGAGLRLVVPLEGWRGERATGAGA